MGDFTVTHEPAWHTSVWPLVLSVGILFLLPLSFAFHFVYQKSLFAILSLGIGAPLVVISIAGWVKEGIEDKHGYGEGHSVWAMPLFIVAEALLFAGFFAAYWVTRLSQSSWPPSGTPEMPVIVPVVMTVILLSSSVTMHLCEERMEEGASGGFLKWLIITIALGAGFFGLSAYEWNELFHEGFNFKTNIYSTAFFSITGFHASHVLVGLGMFACVLVPALAGGHHALAGKVNKPLVKSVSIYWHFVDIIWLFVVSQVYFW